MFRYFFEFRKLLINNRDNAPTKMLMNTLLLYVRINVIFYLLYGLTKIKNVFFL